MKPEYEPVMATVNSALSRSEISQGTRMCEYTTNRMGESVWGAFSQTQDRTITSIGSTPLNSSEMRIREKSVVVGEEKIVSKQTSTDMNLWMPANNMASFEGLGEECSQNKPSMLEELNFKPKLEVLNAHRLQSPQNKIIGEGSNSKVVNRASHIT